MTKWKWWSFITNRKKKEDHIPQISINGKLIERVTDFNFLGIIINEHLDWSSHISKISNKICRTNGILNKLKRFLPTHILRQIYCSLILPHFNYGILLWGFKCSKLSKLQKKAIRSVSNSKYNAHSEPLLKKLNLLKIEDIFQACVLKFYYKIKNDKVPRYFQNYSDDVNMIQLRTSQIYQSDTRTINATRCLRHHLPKCLGKTTDLITDKVSTHSYFGFSHYIKRYLIDKYPSTCIIEDCYVCNNWYLNVVLTYLASFLHILQVFRIDFFFISLLHISRYSVYHCLILNTTEILGLVLTSTQFLWILVRPSGDGRTACSTFKLSGWCYGLY